MLKKTQLKLWCLLLSLGLMFSACVVATSPPTRYYLLTPDPDLEARQIKVQQGQDPLISFGPVEIPSYLDRPQIISRTRPNRLHLGQFDHWAEPVQESMTRVLAQNIAGYYPEAQLVIFPTQSRSRADLRIFIRVLGFELLEDSSSVILSAKWTVRDPENNRLICVDTSRFSQPAAKGDYAQTVQAMSRTLNDLSLAIVNCLRTNHH